MDSNYIFNITSTMLQGAKITILVFFIVIIASIPLGFFVTLLGRSKFKPIGWLVNIYITIMRGTPLILQLFSVYFALPYVPLICKYITLDRFPAALIAFILNYAAYFGEIFRSGIQSIERGQREAANILGFKTIQFYRFILLPQAIKRTLPAIGNEVITLVKDTSLVYVVAVNDILRVAKGAGGRDANTLLAYVAAGLLYLAMTYVITRLFEIIEKKVQYEE